METKERKGIRDLKVHPGPKDCKEKLVQKETSENPVMKVLRENREKWEILESMVRNLAITPRRILHQLSKIRLRRVFWIKFPIQAPKRSGINSISENMENPTIQATRGNKVRQVRMDDPETLDLLDCLVSLETKELKETKESRVRRAR